MIHKRHLGTVSRRRHMEKAVPLSNRPKPAERRVRRQRKEFFPERAPAGIIGKLPVDFRSGASWLLNVRELLQQERKC
jgi:hypothetical protein